ncbi:MAG: hypothetical protein P4N60_03240 [Verrucomicrobiae bacterium]|nr:hypothetical protein [Verrucomicrobiae bacterium]
MTAPGWMNFDNLKISPHSRGRNDSLKSPIIEIRRATSGSAAMFAEMARRFKTVAVFCWPTSIRPKYNPPMAKDRLQNRPSINFRPHSQHDQIDRLFSELAFSDLAEDGVCSSHIMFNGDAALLRFDRWRGISRRSGI